MFYSLLFCNFAAKPKINYGSKKKKYRRGRREEGPSLEDFVVHEKIKAFIDAYMPTDLERLATEVFDDARLRTFFKAYPVR